MLPREWDDYFSRAGDQYGVDPNILKAQATVESGGDPNAVSSTGARGPMQFMPATAKALGIDDPTDPQQAIFGAANLMRQNYDRYGDWDTALQAYHGGTNQKNWGPLTQAYPRKVRAAMDDTSISQQPLGPGFQYFPDQGDGRGAFYMNSDTGQMVPAQVASRPGDQPMGQGQAPQGDPDQAVVDPSTFPPFGNTRNASAVALQQQPQAQPQAQPRHAPGGFDFTQLPTGNITDDPTYGPLAKYKMLAGMFGNQGIIGGAMAGLADTYGKRLDNNVMLQRLEAQFGPKMMQPLGRMLNAGVPYDTAATVLGLPKGALGQAGQFSSKPMSSADLKQEQEDLEKFQALNTSRSRLHYLRGLISDKKLQFYPGIEGLSDIKIGANGAAKALVGSKPFNDENAQNYKSFMSTISGIQGDNLNSAHGVQTDADAKSEFERLMPNTTSTDTVNNHLNNLVNNYETRENQIRERINQRRAANRQPPVDWASIDRTTPRGAPQQSSSQLMSNPYVNHDQGGGGGAGGVGQGALSVGETRNVGGVPIKRIQ